MEPVVSGMLGTRSGFLESMFQVHQMLALVRRWYVIIFCSTLKSFGHRTHWKFLLGKSNFTSSNVASTSNASQSHQILCCAYNANGTIFVTGSSDSNARVCVKLSTLVILLGNAETAGNGIWFWFAC